MKIKYSRIGFTDDFEAHITVANDENLPVFTNICKENNIKVITISNFNKNNKLASIHKMTSHVFEAASYFKALADTNYLADILESNGVTVLRVKIETPLPCPYPNNVLYYETHFTVPKGSNNKLPWSYNWDSDKYMITYRSSPASERIFIKEAAIFEEQLPFEVLSKHTEACIYDTNIRLDDGWIK